MSFEYDLYLSEHIENVRRAFYWIKKNIPEILDEPFMPYKIFDTTDSCHIINSHDESKYDSMEYVGYDNYFYPQNGRSYQVMRTFEYSWLHHIHNNPHHWQHWILINDDPDEGVMALEMYPEYIIEMICDWWSFSWKTGDLFSIFDWYENHKDYMILHETTRKIVEEILAKMKTTLIYKKENNDV